MPFSATLTQNLSVAIKPFAASALMVALCSTLSPVQAQPAASVPSISAADWQQCLQRLSSQASAAKVGADTWRTIANKLQPDASVLEKLDNQPEFKTPIWDYLAALVDDERVAEGQKLAQLHASTLQQVQQRYGVDPATVVAVWGVESNFGQTTGKYALLQALSTLSCFGRRQAFFQQELWATVRIAQGGHVPAEQLVGSWAGAFGHTQFMPTTYERLAVDFDGDGKRDLVNSIPDALASTANFLAKAGWQANLPWGIEVQLPAGFDISGEGRKTKRSAQTWADRGLKDMQGQSIAQHFSASTPLALLTPAAAASANGQRGPSWLVSKNFDALFSYNAAESYGMALALLSDRLRNPQTVTAPITPWPTDDLGLSRRERRELQALLLQLGHEIGAIDGMLGEKSREAIRKEQLKLGHPVTGRAGQRLLKALKTTPA